jgi:division protein CdvB (Snf7/Vps24/ESCRT-III family)
VSGDDAIVEALKAADAAIGASMSEVGEASVEADMASPKDKLDSLVKSHMDENAMPKAAFAKAYAAVAKTDEGKALIKELYKGE